MGRPFEFGVGEYYHIYQRGNDRREIFHDDADYARFSLLLYICNHADGAIHASDYARADHKKLFLRPRNALTDIGAYCLMKNHFHLLLHERTERGISLFMQKLTTAYVMYYNKKYNRRGAFFEGTFRAKHADKDEYLKYLFSYIHLNPVKYIEPDWRKSGISDLQKVHNFLNDFKYFSFTEYMDNTPNIRPESAILNKEPFPQYFLEKGDFDKFINDWILVSRFNLDSKE